MVSIRSIPTSPGSLTHADLPWIVEHREDRCTLCGKCTSVCPKDAIHLAYKRQRTPNTSLDKSKQEMGYKTFISIQQRTDIDRRCIGCAMCSEVCPNTAIWPVLNTDTNRDQFNRHLRGAAWTRGGRRNDTSSLLDQIIFKRISMLTDPALDAGRHEFQVNTLLGRVLSLSLIHI